MHDSLEDYIGISKNVKQDEKQVNVERLKLAVQKQKECQDRAMKIVYFLIEGKLKKEAFLPCLKYIDQAYYQDIVEERAISKLCGYCLCGKRIPDMPTKKFHISSKQNKVYDITDRKNYCSNACYSASVHIKSQIETSPLWSRKPEESPKFHLLESSNSVQPGMEIDQGIVKPPDDTNFTSVSLFAEAAMSEMFTDEKKDKTKAKRAIRKPHKTMSTISEQKELNETIESEHSFTDKTKQPQAASKTKECLAYDLKTKENASSELKTKKCLTDNFKTEEIGSSELKTKECLTDSLETKPCLINEVKTKECLTDDTETSASATNELKTEEHATNELKTKECLTDKPGTSASLTNELKTEKHLTNELNITENLPKELELKENKPVNTVCRAVKENVANDTKKLSNVNKNAPETKTMSINILNKIKTHVKEWLTLETFIYLHGEEKIKEHLDETKISNYFESLKVDELQTSQQIKYVNICRRLRLQELADEKFDSSVTGKSLKVVPDYRKLKEEGKMLDIKVRSFYGGVLYEQEDSNFPSKIKDVNNERDEEEETVLPLVENKAQNALRKKIFLQAVNKVMHSLLATVNLNTSAVHSDIQHLVKTFRLRADNIMFRPLVWSIIGLVLLHMLGMKDEHVRRKLEEKKAKEYIQLLLKRFPESEQFFSDVLSTVSDVEAFVQYYIKENS